MIDLRKSLLTCQVCKKEKKDTTTRYVKNPGYSGPCGDSFCYHGCDMDTCKTPTFQMMSCEACAKKYEAQLTKKKVAKKTTGKKKT